MKKSVFSPHREQYHDSGCSLIINSHGKCHKDNKINRAIIADYTISLLSQVGNPVTGLQHNHLLMACAEATIEERVKFFDNVKNFSYIFDTTRIDPEGQIIPEHYLSEASDLFEPQVFVGGKPLSELLKLSLKQIKDGVTKKLSAKLKSLIDYYKSSEQAKSDTGERFSEKFHARHIPDPHIQVSNKKLLDQWIESGGFWVTFDQIEAKRDVEIGLHFLSEKSLIYITPKMTAQTYEWTLSDILANVVPRLKIVFKVSPISSFASPADNQETKMGENTASSSQSESSNASPYLSSSSSPPLTMQSENPSPTKLDKLTSPDETTSLPSVPPSPVIKDSTASSEPQPSVDPEPKAAVGEGSIIGSLSDFLKVNRVIKLLGIYFDDTDDYKSCNTFNRQHFSCSDSWLPDEQCWEVAIAGNAKIILDCCSNID